MCGCSKFCNGHHRRVRSRFKCFLLSTATNTVSREVRRSGSPARHHDGIGEVFALVTRVRLHGRSLLVWCGGESLPEVSLVIANGVAVGFDCKRRRQAAEILVP